MLEGLKLSNVLGKYMTEVEIKYERERDETWYGRQPVIIIAYLSRM